MEYVRFTIKALAFSLLAAFAVGYGYLVYTGDLPMPNINAMVNHLTPAVSASGSTVAVVAIAICFIVTAVAPLIYAVRSGDAFTVMVSIVALVVCFALLIYSRTVIDMVLAAIVYFTSAFISVIVYSTARVSEALRERADASRA